MVIWKAAPVVIEHKHWHVREIGGKRCRAFAQDFGDVPVAHFNPVTKKFEDVVNNRGNAYATRKRKQFRKKKV